MAYEFQKLSDVTLAETAAGTAHVLVEEDGEIKRVPKKEVGGVGGLVVELTEDNTQALDESTFTSTYNYDEIYDVLMAGGSVHVDVTAYVKLMTGPDASTLSMYRIVPLNWILVQGEGLITFGLLEGEQVGVVFTNGSHHAA